MSSTEGKKITIKGGCHCGYVSTKQNTNKSHYYKPRKELTPPPPPSSFITYTATTTLSPRNNLTAIRCNCTFCQNLGYTSLHLASSADFTLHSPSSLDHAQLGDYAPRVKSVHRYFCRECGSHVWMQGEYPLGESKVMPIMVVNLGTVEVEGLRVEGVDLRRTEIGYYDMARGNVEGGLKGDGPWEGGLV
jgi:hypothetical protein